MSGGQVAVRRNSWGVLFSQYILVHSQKVFFSDRSDTWWDDLLYSGHIFTLIKHEKKVLQKYPARHHYEKCNMVCMQPQLDTFLHNIKSWATQTVESWKCIAFYEQLFILLVKLSLS